MYTIRIKTAVVAILGMGGIGKTALSVKLAHKVESQFEFVIWRPLHNAPPLYNLLNSLVQPGRSKPAATKGVITGVNLE